MGIGGTPSTTSQPAMTLAAFTAKIAPLSTDDLIQLISRMIDEGIFNACFDAAVDEACHRDESLAVAIDAMF